ncbi:hypothetical protein [Permianibacter aggregans]|uniref:hypothetical protein n=1 Tax=Permianibacter aggregans TaxID=1510150 RepID=UPI00106016CC|nr:hypothetical protein [Permianibacter aggregans]QGX41520.1 hypothetical protein E2H98_18330 [Permianibacter aggregans]
MKKLVLFALLFVVARVNAAPQWCVGTLDLVWIDIHGNVFTRPSWRNDHIRICNLKGSDGVTDTVTCSSWYSQVAQAVKDNRQTTIQYSDIPSCATIPTYGNAPVPYYVMIHR